MGYSELIKSISSTTEMKAETVRIVLDGFKDVVMQTLSEGDNVSVPQFGIFKVKTVEARVARNPRTGEQVNVPAHNSVRFRPSSTLKNYVY